MKVEKEIVSFGWTRPLSTGSNYLEYIIQCPYTNVTKKYKGNMYEFTTIEIQPGNGYTQCEVSNN